MQIFWLLFAESLFTISSSIKQSGHVDFMVMHKQRHWYSHTQHRLKL